MNSITHVCKEAFEKVGLQQKKISSQIWTELEESEDKTPAQETVGTRLSKLLNGDIEGIKFFFKTDFRLLALCKALELESETLRVLYEEKKHCVILLLDPRLPPEVAEFLKKQEKQSEGAYQCVEVEENAEPKNILKREAQCYPNVLIVSENVRDRVFFEGAELRATTFEKVPRGWILTSERNLVPIPLPPPPILFDENGIPMIPFEQLQEKSQKSWGTLSNRTKQILDIGGIPTYRVEEVINFLFPRTNNYYPFPCVPRVLYSSIDSSPVMCEELLCDHLKGTYVWLTKGDGEGNKRKICVVGPESKRIFDIFGKFHEVEDGTSHLKELQEFIYNYNPYIIWKCREGRFHHDLTGEGCKLLEKLLSGSKDRKEKESIKDFLWKWAIPKIQESSTCCGKFDTSEKLENSNFSFFPSSFSLSEKLQTQICKLLERNWEVPRKYTHFSFLLFQLLNKSDVIEFVIPIENYCLCQFLLPDGQFVLFFMSSYSSTKQEVIRFHDLGFKDFVHFDGGDIHFGFFSLG